MCHPEACLFCVMISQYPLFVCSGCDSNGEQLGEGLRREIGEDARSGTKITPFHFWLLDKMQLIGFPDPPAVCIQVNLTTNEIARGEQHQKNNNKKIIDAKDDKLQLTRTNKLLAAQFWPLSADIYRLQETQV